MKGIYISSVALIFICMVLFPLISMDKTVLPSPPSDTSSTQSEDGNDETLRVYLTEEDKVTVMTVKDYVTGVVLAEMPAEYHEEALKAQAVVAYTYALYKKDIRKSEDYDVTDTSAKDQAFLSYDEAKEKFKASYEKYLDKVSAAVNAVEGEVILYGDKPILACCHSISGGKTESAETLWGGSYPYLQPVESAGDVLSPGYLSEAKISKEDFQNAFSEQKIEFKGEADEWITDINRSSSGYILSLKVCGTEIKGSTFRSCLKLRSTNFDLEIKDDSFIFSVRGYGHGVGMSQSGAQYMALQGSTYTDILMWYYTDCTVIKYTHAK